MQIRDINIETCIAALSETKAAFAPDSLTMVPLGDVEQVTVEWGPFPTPRDLTEYKEFLRWFTWVRNAQDSPNVEKTYVAGDSPDDVAFTVEGQEFRGRWRQAYVRERKGESRDRQVQYFVQITLRAGYVEAYDASELRVTRLFDKEGNAVDVDGKTWTNSTTSANPGLALYVTLPNCSREAAGTVLGGFPATMAAAASVDGYTIPNTLYKTVGDAQRVDDGSSTVTVIYADERFAFNGFESSNTTDERNIGYLWNVPRQLGEAISDEWRNEADTARRGCTASISGDGQGYINLVLTARTGEKDNLTTMWVPISCDTYERYHFAWGYTKAELYDEVPAGTTFFASHDSAIGTTEDGEVIRSRRITVQQRGDALYDAIITERSWGGGDTTADFTITLPVGTKITRQFDYGYNFAIAELNTAKTTYDTTIKAVGKSVDFRVTREDDCSFDWTATITTVTEIDSGQKSKQPAGDAGVGNIIQTLNHATAAELDTALLAYTPAIGKTLQLTVGVNDDETYSGTFREITAQTPEHTGAITIADPGLGVSVASGHNATAAEVTAAIGNFTAGARLSHTIDMRAADDGGWDYFIRESTVNETADQSVSDATAGIGYNFRYGRNQDAAPAITAAKRKRISGQVTANDDGTLNHALTEQTVQETAGADIETTGSTGVSVKMRYGHNQDAEPAIVRDRLKRISGSIRANDDGTIDHGITEETIVESDKTIQAGSKGENTAVRVSRNDLGTTLDADVYPTAVGQRVVLQAQFDDAGNLSFRKDTVQKVEQNQTTKGGSYTRTRTVKKSVGDVGFNELDASASVAEGTSISWQAARLDADGSIDWDKITDAAVARNVGSITLKRLEPSLDKHGYTDTATVFRGIASANIGTYDIDSGSEYGYIERLTMNDDGTFDGVKIVRVYQGSIGASWANNADVEDITAEDPSNTAPGEWTRRFLIWNTDYSQYKKGSADYEELWTDDYGEIVNFLDYTTAGGSHHDGFVGQNEGPVYRDVSGRSYWWGRKMVGITVDQTWTANTGAEITA